MEPNDDTPYGMLFFLFFIALFIIYGLGIRPVMLLVQWYRNKNLHLFLPQLKQEYYVYITRNFPFYNRLNLKGQRIFEGRVQKFIDSKEFIIRGGMPEFTPEMKTLIAGTAVQLTFGYPDVYFDHFEKILIYPYEYYSVLTKHYHKGEVNPGGIIVLSWSDLKAGFQDQTDGIHLGLHEMAHALRLIRKMEYDEEYQFFDTGKMNAFDALANAEMSKMTEGEEPSLFRDYGATNSDEFFSVAVEVFFEKPDEFFNYNPKLYGALSHVLKMDLREGSKVPFMA